MSKNIKGYITDEGIIKNAKFIPAAIFLASNQLQARIDVVKSILASGKNVAIVYWQDGAKAYIPIAANIEVPSDTLLIKAYRGFHDIKSKNPELRGRIWIKV